MEEVTIRRASREEYPELAGLRWRWVRDELASEPLDDEDGFIDAFVTWARTHEDSHVAFVAVAGERLVGMTGVALTSRVPSPRRIQRKTADLQSVYVVPEARNRGIGDSLIRAALDWAIGAGAERAGVHSSERAVTAYQRAGFATNSILLDRGLG